MIYTRREIARLAMAVPLSAVLAKAIDSKVNGVMLGAQSYSFRDRSLDDAISAMKDVGIGYVELWQGHLEPKDHAEAKKGREDPPLDQMKAARKKLDDAGI